MAKKKTKAVKQTKVKRVNKKHFIIFNNGGVISASTPKDWARANRHLFDKFTFSDSDNTPIVELIEKTLENKGFRKTSNGEVVIYYDYISL
jgi:hypothetical protein